MKFCSISDCAQNDVSVKHPDIGLGFDRISAFVPDTGSPDSESLVLGKLRLYPGGLAALLLVGNHRCGPTSCGESGLPLIMSTRLVLFNWQRGTALGVSVELLLIERRTVLICRSSKFQTRPSKSLISDFLMIGRSSAAPYE